MIGDANARARARKVEKKVGNKDGAMTMVVVTAVVGSGGGAKENTCVTTE